MNSHNHTTVDCVACLRLKDSHKDHKSLVGMTICQSTTSTTSNLSILKYHIVNPLLPLCLLHVKSFTSNYPILSGALVIDEPFQFKL